MKRKVKKRYKMETPADTAALGESPYFHLLSRKHELIE